MAILANQKVLTLDYWKPASKLQVGDYVFNLKGEPTKITLIQPVEPIQCYEVTFSDHLTLCGDQNLALPVESPQYRIQSCYYKGKYKFRRELEVFPLSDLLEKPFKDKRGRQYYSVPTTNPLAFPSQDLPIPPFLFGFWYFARRSTKRLAAPKGKSEIVHQIFKDHGYKVTTHRLVNTGEPEFSIKPDITQQLKPLTPTSIPTNYLLASYEQRIELLKGILHAKSRQYSVKKDSFRITDRHEPTIRQVQSLVESLGLRTTLEFDSTYGYFTLKFRSRLQLVEEQVSPRLKVHVSRRYVTKIKPIQNQACIHIETDSNILVGEGFIACR